MIVLDRFVGEPGPCPYLAGRQEQTENEIVAALSPAEYEARMNQGWRKFGPVVFRPVCQSCDECRPLRVPVARFAPDRSQRRNLARNADLAVRYAAPTIDAARVSLFNRYHAAQTDRKGWPAAAKTADEYAFVFVHNPVPAVEISVWENDVLQAIVLADVTQAVVSAVYHFHDPDGRARGLGTFALLQTIALARRLGKPHAYLGFFVAGCPSMTYKARFRPCEILGVDGVWRARSAGP